MNAADAKSFISRWLAAANSHDIDQLMAFYADDAELESPVVVDSLHLPNGRIKGAEAIRAYLGKSISTFNLHLIESAWGVSSITAWYVNSKGTRTSAYIELGSDGKITRNVNHYS